VGGNLVGRWPKQLSDLRWGRASFASVPALIDVLEVRAGPSEDGPQPLIGLKNAEEVIAAVRSRGASLHQINFATDH
jgi:hypothetical protein